MSSCLRRRAADVTSPAPAHARSVAQAVDQRLGRPLSGASSGATDSAERPSSERIAARHGRRRRSPRALRVALERGLRRRGAVERRRPAATGPSAPGPATCSRRARSRRGSRSPRELAIAPVPHLSDSAGIAIRSMSAAAATAAAAGRRITRPASAPRTPARRASAARAAARREIADPADDLAAARTRGARAARSAPAAA